MSAKGGFFDKVASLLGREPAPRHEPVIPPVDLDVPVTNPGLVAAIRAHQKSQQKETALALLDELKRSFLLAAIVLEGDPTRISPGQVLFKKGARVGVVEVRDPSDARLLAVFTDHEELRSFTEQGNSTLVMPAKDALAFVLEHGYAGIVINAASEATLRLDTPFIRTIIGGM